MPRYACIIFGVVSSWFVIVRNEFKVSGKFGKCTTTKQYSEPLFSFILNQGLGQLLRPLRWPQVPKYKHKDF